MRKRYMHTVLALGFGGLSLYVFYALAGVVKVMSMKQGLDRWIFKLPNSLQQTAYLLQNNVEGLLVAVLVMGASGIVLGLIIENKPAFFGFMQFVGAAIFYFIFHLVVLNGDFMWIDDIPTWSQVLPFLSWFLIFMCAPIIGNNKVKGYFSRSR